ncbi:hypothetical protein GGR56DRAFT_633090 [Xylariaceae sp. FL0804]|nr:hypothetical protein GGR56DRAFT_633090 [Xylariaceae sp. FL0804]
MQLVYLLVYLALPGQCARRDRGYHAPPGRRTACDISICAKERRGSLLRRGGKGKGGSGARQRAREVTSMVESACLPFSAGAMVIDRLAHPFTAIESNDLPPSLPHCKKRASYYSTWSST